MRIIVSILFILTLSALQGFSQALFNPNQITTIEITFTQNNWDQLLNNLYAAGNGDRLLATVEINGTSFDSVGVRYRGGGTYLPANLKNPLNIKLDFVKSQNYEGYDVIKLSNGAKDPSWLREVMTFEIARNYMVAPKANYASVYINGNFHGLYANVESINSSFFQNRFLSNPDNPRFECSPTYSFDNPPATAPFGCTVGNGSNLEYLGDGIICYFDHYQIQSMTGWDALRDMASLLKNSPNNAKQQLDLDRFIWLSAMNSLLANLDSYLGAGSRNYFIGKADNGRFVPVPDDLNESFARFPWATIPQSGAPQPALSFYTSLDPFLGSNNDEKPLLKAIFNNPTWKRMYVAHMRTMISEIFANGWFEQRAEAIQNLIGGEVQSDSKHFYTHSQFLSNLNSTVIDTYAGGNGEDAYGLIPLMQGRISYLLGLPEFQATQPSITNVKATPATPSPGMNVTITAAVSNTNASAVWLGSRNNLKEVFTLSQMFDDGNHGDGAAGDGVFGASVTVGVGGLQYYIYAENNNAGMFSPPRAEFEFHSLGAAGSVVINELMAANQTTKADQNGEFDDWAELYNNSNATVNLSGWYLTDNPAQLTKWTFPNGTFIDANSYLTVWLDDDELQAGLHATFRLDAVGEQLLLVMPNLTVADQVVFGLQTPDVSLARCPNGTGAFVSAPPTFGAVNTPACVVGTDELKEKFEFALYPNPASGKVKLAIKGQGKMTARLISVLGKTMDMIEFSGETEFDVSGLAPGLYFVALEGGEVKRLVVSR